MPACGKPVKATGLCYGHYMKKWRYGTPTPPPRPRHPAYRTAHIDVANARGPASSHRCVDCGRRAHHWSYNHADPNELIGAPGTFGEGWPYSADPDYYEPRCVSCHRKFDIGQPMPGQGVLFDMAGL